MASQAEVDLVISTAGALPELERSLNRIVTTAEDGAPQVDIRAGLRTQETLRSLEGDLRRVARQASNDPDSTVDIRAVLAQADSLRAMNRQIATTIQRAQAGADPVQIRAALNQANALRTVHRQLQGVVATAQRTTPPIRVDVDVDRSALRQGSNLLTRFSGAVLTAAGAAARLTTVVGSAGVAVGALVPVLAAATAAVQQVAPAAAVATTGILALVLATNTVKLAMIGVEDAITAAFDPETKPEDLEKALKRLAPEARKFVVELRSMRTQLRRVQQEVQNRFFQNFDDTLKTLSRTTLPVITTAVNKTATSLNRMALGVANSASQLAKSGTLGRALQGAVDGLQNMERVPGRITTAFGQLAAAASPAFDRITRKVEESTAKIATRLEAAFKTGRLTTAIDQAVSAIGQLFTTIGNFAEGVGNIFGALTQDGRGLFQVLEDISEAFVKLTASKEFQAILNELAKTADTLVKNILPLISEAFVQLGPVIQMLGPIVREFINAVGPELIPVIQELGPILVDIAEILREQLPLAIKLTISVARGLVIVLQAVHFFMEEVLIPVVSFIADLFNNKFVRALAAASNSAGALGALIVRTFPLIRDTISSSISRVLSSLSKAATEIRTGIGAAIIDLGTQVVNFFLALPGRITGILSGLHGVMVGIGANIIRGLISGIQSEVGRLIGIAQGIADQVTSTIKGALGISSPSRVMIEVGKDTGEGFIVGLRRTLPQIENAVSGLGRTIPSFALPEGRSLPLPSTGAQTPQVQVFIGNQVVDRYVDVRVGNAMTTRDRITTQGVRI